MKQGKPYRDAPSTSVTCRRKISRLSMLLAFFAFWSCFAAGCSRNPEEVKREIVAREKASFEAWKMKDKKFYDDYWRDNMTEFLPDDANLVRKSEMMPRFEEITKNWKLDSLEILDPEVEVYGDVAVLTYREVVSGSSKGQPSHYIGKVTMIYLNERGRWRGVHYHESKNTELH